MKTWREPFLIQLSVHHCIFLHTPALHCIFMKTPFNFMLAGSIIALRVHGHSSLHLIYKHTHSATSLLTNAYSVSLHELHMHSQPLNWFPCLLRNYDPYSCILRRFLLCICILSYRTAYTRTCRICHYTAYLCLSYTPRILVNLQYYVDYLYIYLDSISHFALFLILSLHVCNKIFALWAL